MEIKNYYTERGCGKPLILLHGNGESSDYFSEQIEYFSKKYRVIAIDTRGHGRTPRGEAPFTIHQFADDLKDFLDELAIDKCYLLGFSDGGNIAIIFALKYHDRVEKLVLNGANIDVNGMKFLVKVYAQLGYGMSKLLAGFFGKLEGADKKWTGYYEKAKHNMELYALMVKYPAIDARYLARIHIPVLVVAGTRDMIKEKHTRLIQRSIVGAKLAIIKGTHFVAKKRPEAFNEKVQEFLDE